MSEQKEVTGNDLADAINQLGLKVKDVAEYWGIDRNTILAYKRLGDEPLPRNRMMQILIDDLHANFSKS